VHDIRSGQLNVTGYPRVSAALTASNWPVTTLASLNGKCDIAVAFPDRKRQLIVETSEPKLEQRCCTM
jgi:hypothetical protein